MQFSLLYTVQMQSTVIVLICLCNSILCQITLVPEVAVEEGTLRGASYTSRDGKQYFAFKGIRYAEKPERFQIAEPIKSWEGVKDASEPGKPCLHTYPSTAGALLGTMGSEDCLFLHVFAPTENKGKTTPVMVYIHGGAFLFGAGDQFGSAYFMDEDVILVTFNYRLGALGFLYNEDDLIPGNLGMRDQILALQWVQRNIHHFGGDPSQVTLLGESAGAASVHLHILSPMATGLFSRAILMSGSALSPWAISTSPKSNIERLAAGVGCPTGNPREMVNCLKIVDGGTIAQVQTETRLGTLPEYHWAPVVERGLSVDGTNSFLSEHPQILVAKKQIPNSVPTIMGVNKNEGAAFFSAFILADAGFTHEMNFNWDKVAPRALSYLNDGDRDGDRDRSEVNPRHDQASFKIRKFYFGNYPVGLETEQRLTDLFSDRYFIHGMVTSAKALRELSPTYLYLFTFTVGFSFLNFLGVHNFEPPKHGDCVPYLFPFMIRSSLSNPVEIDFSKKFVKMWTSFAINGRPEATWGSAKTWPMINATDSEMTWYRLDVNTKLIHDPFRNRIKFWDNLVANELRKIG